MKRGIVVTLGLCFVAIMPASNLSAQDHRWVADTSGLSIFWRIHGLLIRGSEPPDSVWDALWRTPGYALLDRREGRRPLLTKAMRLAYLPALRQSGDSAIAAAGSVSTPEGWIGWVLPHLRRIDLMKDSLRIFSRTIQSGAALAQAARLAQHYLPARLVDTVPLPGLSFLYFIDARGYDPILFDPLYLMELTNPLQVMGHELHHNYRIRVARPLRRLGGDMLAWRLVTTEIEGVAGLVDMAEVPGLSREALRARYAIPRLFDYYVEYQADYRRSNQWLAWVESLLERVDTHPDSASAIGNELAATLPDNGRIVGAFMAVTIERYLGRERLLEVVGAPFAFWQRYNEAARLSKGQAHVLSEGAIRTVERVRQTYTP